MTTNGLERGICGLPPPLTVKLIDDLLYGFLVTSLFCFCVVNVFYSTVKVLSNTSTIVA